MLHCIPSRKQSNESAFVKSGENDEIILIPPSI